MARTDDLPEPTSAGLPAGEIFMSHVSINFDRAEFQRDLNVREEPR